MKIFIFIFKKKLDFFYILTLIIFFQNNLERKLKCFFYKNPNFQSDIFNIFEESNDE